MTDSRSHGPFRFLHLPAELRLMVYERVLLNRTKRVKLTCPSSPGGAACTLSLISTSVPSTTLLATCRLINHEARPVLQATIQRFLGEDMLLADRLEGPAPRIEIDFVANNILRYRGGLIDRILIRYEELSSNPDSLPGDHIDRGIIGNMFTLESGMKEETIQALQKFIETAAMALLYQQTCIDKARRLHPAPAPRLYPEIQIAVRLYPHKPPSSTGFEDLLSHRFRIGFEDLSSLVTDLKILDGHDKVQTRIHLIEPPSFHSTSSGHRDFAILHNAAKPSNIPAPAVFVPAMPSPPFGLFPFPSADPRQRVIAGEFPFEENKKDVYNRLWREAEW